ncbi:3-hydroxyacyl-CoA dehydrogenase type-2 [Platysternon megacephalum]|uniref:3-hydroxyacyl-CoA dehydrogenase type-2 n=1 Tax=Platysternon megacephalum TaxID=55544 RepID=A0A4D9DTN9_9SAUR|nr:3-hydroxyacyl-CoA dehydrogenase type-2 [Platysternon megacephalum]
MEPRPSKVQSVRGCLLIKAFMARIAFVQQKDKIHSDSHRASSVTLGCWQTLLIKINIDTYPTVFITYTQVYGSHWHLHMKLSVAKVKDALGQGSKHRLNYKF